MWYNKMAWYHRKLILHRFERRIKGLVNLGYKDNYGLIIKRIRNHRDKHLVSLSLNNTYDFTEDDWNLLDHSVRNLFKEIENERIKPSNYGLFKTER